MGDEKIKIATSIPGLKDKIKTHIDADSDSVYWYIRFNIPLDEKTVSHKTMSVTDIEGYIMRTEITYSAKKNMIIIYPLDTYESGIFYLLNIEKKVRSAKGQNMRSRVHILFKLMGRQISEFKVLKSNVEVPSPKPRPKNYEATVVKRLTTSSRLYSFDEKIFEHMAQDKLPLGEMKINMFFGIIGVIILLSYLFFQNTMALIVSMIICIIGVTHIGLQFREKELRSVVVYNKGVRKFNKGKYAEAERLFKRAIYLDEKNELAEFAVNKVAFYK